MIKDEFLTGVNSTERLLLDTKPSDLLTLFYDEVKQHQGTSYPDSKIIDGKTIEFFHVFLFIEPPKKDSLQVIEALHEPGLRPGKITGRAKSLFVQAWRIQEKCRVKVEYSPFFESTVKKLLSMFDHVALIETLKSDVSETDQFKAGLKKIMDIHFPIEEWKPWESIPDDRDDRTIIRLVCHGYGVSEIAKEVIKRPISVSNDLKRLRKYCSKHQIPIPNPDQHRKIKELRNQCKSSK